MHDSFFVYILEYSDGSYYVGSTNDVFTRVQRHNIGEAAGWTKDRCPVKLVYQEEHETLLDFFIPRRSSLTNTLNFFQAQQDIYRLRHSRTSNASRFRNIPSSRLLDNFKISPDSKLFG